MRNSFIYAIAASALWGAVSSAAAPDVEIACSRLASLAIPATNLLSAAVVPQAGELPEYCRVLGYVRPAVNFELRLPTRTWNRKFLMAGCGGYCGSVLSDAPTFLNGLKRGYATVTTDTGHWGAMPLDGRWAYHDPVATAYFAYRGVNETTRVAKHLTAEFYGSRIQYSYFDGCSNGGRQGLIEATRYPEDYDGVIAGAPAQNVVGLAALFTWVSKADRGADGKRILDPAKVGPLFGFGRT